MGFTLQLLHGQLLMLLFWAAGCVWQEVADRTFKRDAVFVQFPPVPRPNTCILIHIENLYLFFFLDTRKSYYQILVPKNHLRRIDCSNNI